MTDSPQTDLTPVGTLLPATVSLQVPAHGEFVGVLRSLGATLAARCDLTVDEIDDLRIAVDEAGGLLIPHAEPGTALAAQFALTAGGIEIVASISPLSASAQPDRSGFAWTVLDAVTDELEVQHQPGRLAIRLVKRREVLTP